MPCYLKQSTAVSIALGPFVDSADGFTAETGLTISQADVRLKKNDGNWAQKGESSSATHEENGWYEVALNTTDTNTLGILIVAVNESGALPVWREFMVVNANVYDSLIAGSDNLQVDAMQIEGSDASNAINAEVVDALSTDTYAEPGQGTPGATISLAAKIGFLYKAWRNRTTQTASAYALYNDDGSTVGQTAAVADNGTTFERSEMDTGA